MLHQKTCVNFNTEFLKTINPEISNTNFNNLKLSNQNIFRKRTSSYSISKKDYKCKVHNRNFYKYCLKCKEDICPQCLYKSHFIHDLFDYENNTLNENQMKLFKEEYIDYINIFSALILKIKEWKDNFNKVISKFEEYIQNNILEKINKMINEYDINKLNYNTIIEYRLIYSLLLENNEEKIKNQKAIKIMKSHLNLKNYGNFHYFDENDNLSSISKEEFLHFNDLINKGNFFQKGNYIIKFLFNNFSLFSNKIKNENNFKNNNKDDNIYFSGKKKKLNRSSNNLLDFSKSKNFKNLLFNENNNKIYEKKKPFDNNKNGEILLDKEELPIFSHNIPSKNEEFNDKIKNNPNNLTLKKWNSVYLIKKHNIENYNLQENNIFSKIKPNKIKNNPVIIYKSRNKNIISDNEDYDDSYNINLEFDYWTESHRSDSFNKGSIIFNNNINNFNNNINNINCKNNFINNYNINNIYSDRNKKSKIYTHKKFNTSLISNKNINQINKTQSDRNNDFNFNTLDLPYYDTLSLNNTNNAISITSSVYREKTINTSNKRKIEIDNLNNNWKIKRVKEFLIDINKDLNIGFELGNSDCKIGIVNQLSNCVELWTPYEDKNNANKLGIPTLISFKDQNNNIIIGNNAEELKINNPKHTIYNFINYIGKSWNEINGKKELRGYKLYNNLNTGRPYIKGYLNEFKNKIYHIEELLTLYLRKLFELLFSKIKIKNDRNNNLIKINIVITVPNNFNYFQMKVIKNIFLTQIFQKKNINNNKKNINNDKNNMLNIFEKYNIQVNNIKIENSSNIGYLYLYQMLIDNNLNINKNIILIHIEGGSINISLISALIRNDFTKKDTRNNNKYFNKYEIKEIKGTNFGEEDFTDNFVNSCLSNFTEKIRDKCIKTPEILAKLRKSCETAKIYFYKTNQTEINIQKLYDNIDLKMNLNKMDYERACNEYFEKLNELIKDLLLKSNISEKEIDDIIFVGNTTNVNIIEQKLSKIFKSKNNELFNKLANNKYFGKDKNNNDIINEDYIVIGASLQCCNLYSNKINNYKIIEITPISFGIESLNKKMDFVIKKGSLIPTQVNKYVKIIRPKGEDISINIYEGEDEFVNNNRLISIFKINVKNLKNEKKEKDYIEILIQFIINQNFDLSVFILDNKTLKKKFECIINFDIVKE